jgi:hypothetical protein
LLRKWAEVDFLINYLALEEASRIDGKYSWTKRREIFFIRGDWYLALADVIDETFFVKGIDSEGSTVYVILALPSSAKHNPFYNELTTVSNFNSQTSVDGTSLFVENHPHLRLHHLP